MTSSTYVTNRKSSVAYRLGAVDNALVLINQVALRRARLLRDYPETGNHIDIGYNQPFRSTQPPNPPGKVNRVSACLAGVYMWSGIMRINLAHQDTVTEKNKIQRRKEKHISTKLHF